MVARCRSQYTKSNNALVNSRVNEDQVNASAPPEIRSGASKTYISTGLPMNTREHMHKQMVVMRIGKSSLYNGSHFSFIVFAFYI